MLKSEADAALEKGPFSVMDKTSLPPDGDKHNYTALHPYYWPNPSTPDGLPYIHRDGEVNPDSLSERFDRTVLLELNSAVETLAFAYYYTRFKPYAANAARLVRVWFLDDATRMNANLQYSHIIPGIENNGSRGAIIRGVPLVIDLLDLVQILSDSEEWTDNDRKGYREWLDEYLQWLLNSERGEQESVKANNHGSWYYAQVLSILAALSNYESVEKIIRETIIPRINRQIEPDGRQPEELRRTCAFHYSLFNLRALSCIARIGERVGIDLWNYESEDGRSIKKALDWILNYADGTVEWPYKQIKEFNRTREIASILHMSAARYKEDSYGQIYTKIKCYTVGDRINVMYPIRR